MTMKEYLFGTYQTADNLPMGKRNQVKNNISKINSLIKKTDRIMEKVNTEAEGKYIAKQAIFQAMMNGRHLSQLDCREFQVEDMRTPISHLRDKFEPTHELKSKWIVTPRRNVRIKEYWLERREA